MTEFWPRPNSDVKTSNGSIPRRSNLSTQVQLACHEAGAAVRIIISDGLMTQVGRAPPALWRRLYLGWGITQIPDGIFIFSCTESWVSRCASHGRRRHISFFLFCVRWFAALVHIMRCAVARTVDSCSPGTEMRRRPEMIFG